MCCTMQQMKPGKHVVRSRYFLEFSICGSLADAVFAAEVSGSAQFTQCISLFEKWM